ncbi:MAG TPA: hypothetical protein VF062_23435 [Candidatus Limnocylindrales bacterium]
MTRQEALDIIAGLLPGQTTEASFATRDRRLRAGRILDALQPHIRRRQADALEAVADRHRGVVSTARLRNLAGQLSDGSLSIVRADVLGLATATKED